VRPAGPNADPLRDRRTATIVKAAETCEYVSIESLLNLDAVTTAARGRAAAVAVPCAGFNDRAYRIVQAPA
jgi:hypothetical protein